MKPRELLRLLMARDKIKTNALARAVKNKPNQSQIHRFLTGEAAEPRRATLKPIADHFGIPLDALCDSEAAAKLAAALGLVDGESVAQMETAGAAEEQPVAIDLFTALRYLSESLMRVDSLDRGMASHLLSELATNPGGVGTVAVKLARLLGETAAPPDSSTRVDSCQETAGNLNDTRPMGPRFSNFTARNDDPPQQDQAETGGAK